jgi:hypothetical protein
VGLKDAMSGGLERVIYAVKRHIPPRTWSAVTAPYWWWHNRARHQAAAWRDGRLRASAARLAEFRNRHSGQRCFILGNGPSLALTDWSRLRGEITFGLNRVYLLFPSMGYATTYYVAVNTLVIEQCAGEIESLPLPRFLTWRARAWFPRSSSVIYLDTDYTGPETFSTEITGRVFEGSTVTYVALQLAFHMGFQQVVLLGVDHNFSTQGRPNVTVVSEVPDRDHFSPDYFGRGFRWQLPDLVASERAYGLARQAYEADGRQVVDATVGGRLTVFPKADFESLWR